MRRNRLNFWIDTLALLVMLGLLATGWLIRYTLPAGTGGGGRGAAWTLWGWTRHQWGDLHFWLAVATVSLLLVHVALHWAWVCAMAQSLLPGADHGRRHPGVASRTVLGTATLLLLTGALGLLAWMAEARVNRPAMALAGSGWATLGTAEADREGQTRVCSEADGGHQIRGYMTLEQVASQSGVSIRDLRQRLGLPDSVSDQEKLGRLRRGQGLEIAVVRAAARERSGSSAAQ